MSNFTGEIVDFLSNITNNVTTEKNSIQAKDISIIALTLGNTYNVINSEKTIIIHEDIWHTKKDVVKSRLRSILGNTTTIHGRTTKVEAIANDVLTDFLNIHHLNVPVKTKFRYGLYHKNELVAVAAFSKPRKYYRTDDVYNSFELVRYCSLSDHTVTGGLSKLIKHFIKEQQPDDIVTYIDKEWSEGNGFKRLGFRLIEQTPPQYFYVDPNSFERHYARNQDTDIKVSNCGNYKLMLDLKNG